MTTNNGIARQKPSVKTIKVHARDEDFRIVQLVGNLFVCSKAHGNCCCGWTEKGRAPLNIALYEREWERRKIRNQVHLTFTGCLGPCAVGNNALLQIYGQSVWFKDLNDDRFIPAIYDYIDAILAAGHIVEPPADLREHVYARYLPTVSTGHDTILLDVADASDDDGGLERLDPVCLMDVDPATARWSSTYEGRTYYFCAPSCKKMFDRDPQAYVTA
jgi:YHS domain-containing protein/(2Fe-2S) ferredoxin